MAVLLGAVMALMGPALAQSGSGEQPPPTVQPPTPPGEKPPEVAPDIERREPTVLPQRQERGATLPFTGGDLIGLIVVGGAASTVGAVLVRRTRGRTANL